MRELPQNRLDDARLIFFGTFEQAEGAFVREPKVFQVKRAGREVIRFWEVIVGGRGVKSQLWRKGRYRSAKAARGRRSARDLEAEFGTRVTGPGWLPAA